MNRFPNLAKICLLSSVVLFGSTPGLADADQLDKRISLNLNKAEADQLFPLFAQMIDAQIEIDFETDRRVSLVFEEISVRTALNAFCESINCAWELVIDTPNILRFVDPRRATDRGPWTEPDLEMQMRLDLSVAEAPQVFELAARVLYADLDLNFFLRDDTISLTHEGPLWALLDAICDQIDCRWELLAGNPPMLKVEPRSSP